MNAPLFKVTSQTRTIACPRCDKVMLDGNVLLTRVLIIGRDGSEAKCPRCKAMVKVPLVLTPAVVSA